MPQDQILQRTSVVTSACRALATDFGFTWGRYGPIIANESMDGQWTRMDIIHSDKDGPIIVIEKSLGDQRIRMDNTDSDGHGPIILTLSSWGRLVSVL